MGLHSGAVSPGPESCSEACSGAKGWGPHYNPPALQSMTFSAIGKDEWWGWACCVGLAVEVMSPLPLSVSRTESVAEKMLTNWFTFLLYKFLKVGGLGSRERQEGVEDR